MHTTDDLHPLLRQEVGRLRAGESRRVFDAAVNVGRLAAARARFVARAQDIPALDPALRIDVVSALVEEAASGPLTVWLTRPGTPDTHEEDLRWLSAAEIACGQHDRTMAGFYAITRTGWLNVHTGQQQTWKRLRL